MLTSLQPNSPSKGKVVLCIVLQERLLFIKTRLLLFRLVSHNYRFCLATVADIRSQHFLDIDTRLVEPFEGSSGSLFQFIGEMDCLAENTDKLLKARVVRCVDGLDVMLYNQALQHQNEYLNNR